MEHNFHISLPCLHIAATRKFYETILGAKIGRSAVNWVDVNLHGNQITFSKSGKYKFEYPSYSFEKIVLPSFHFGIILNEKEWKKHHAKMKAENFFHIPETKFLTGKKGAHKSFFLRDPNGYIIEFKCFDNNSEAFET